MEGRKILVTGAEGDTARLIVEVMHARIDIETDEGLTRYKTERYNI